MEQIRKDSTMAVIFVKPWILFYIEPPLLSGNADA